MNLFKDKLFHIFIYSLILGGLLYLAVSSTIPKFINAPVSPQTDISTIKEIIYTDVVQYNIAYLSLSLVIIVLIGGIFYLFNLHPLQESIKEQGGRLQKEKENIKEFQSRVESNFLDVGMDIQKQLSEAKEEMRREAQTLDGEINKQVTDSIKSLEKKFGTSLAVADEKITEIKKGAEQIEMDAVWYQHYMWEARDIPLNTLSSLSKYLGLSLKYKKLFLSDLCLRRISQTLDKLKGVSMDAEDRKLYLQLVKHIEKISGYGAIKEEVLKKAGEIFA